MTGQQPPGKERSRYPRMARGLGVGIAIGVALGVALHNAGLGIALGVAIGAGIGATWRPGDPGDRND